MKGWEKAVVTPDATLQDAMMAIDRAGCRIALVAGADRKLLGTLTDGDIRRGLLRGLALRDSATAAMHLSPTVARSADEPASLLATMRRLGLHQLPVIDADGVLVGLYLLSDFLEVPARDNWVVIMAGGMGSRLQELTRETPKPMLKVGSRPLLETIVRSWADQGFTNFYFAVNYKAEQIEAHFGDGAKFGARIEYLREKFRLGTAGALSLLPRRPEHPIIITNADLLTKENYGHMLDRHVELCADATMAVRDYEMQVPFGVVHERDGSIVHIEEKPLQRFVVSAGMYVLSPAVLDLVPGEQFLDMPSLFDRVMRAGLHTRCHHIDGYWLDIGRYQDYERANADFTEHFDDR